MPVKFDSLDGNARTAVFSVPDGVGGQQLVTREVADGITNDSLDKHLIALAGGLAGLVAGGSLSGNTVPSSENRAS